VLILEIQQSFLHQVVFLAERAFEGFLDPEALFRGHDPVLVFNDLSGAYGSLVRPDGMVAVLESMSFGHAAPIVKQHLATDRILSDGLLPGRASGIDPVASAGRNKTRV
jgi:hypothetical protein